MSFTHYFDKYSANKSKGNKNNNKNKNKKESNNMLDYYYFLTDTTFFISDLKPIDWLHKPPGTGCKKSSGGKIFRRVLNVLLKLFTLLHEMRIG